MKRLTLFFILLSVGLFSLVPIVLGAQVESPTFQMEITGVNASLPPVVTVTATVLDSLSQPVFGLTADNFRIVGELAGQAQIVSVENISDNNLSFGVVLAIDTSSSMAGLPLERAQEAARAFVNSIGPNDPVAIVTFDSEARLVQAFTTDKGVLLNAINTLGYGGKTALYDAGVEAIVQAAASELPRRAVILLSDGAEYGGRSVNDRSAALNEAFKRGVPVYTIGLGYGFDRTYLTELSDGTNAKFFESPTPDELLQIYQGLANTLRSQYVITVNANVPGDGHEYPLTIEVTTDENTASATAILRAPIPVPLVSLTDLPSGVIGEPTTVTASVIAD
ncbi:MAG: VWA domain-containing protein, partial [Anaerolineae bacterium]|nr:VWA domain-containing protein [Anaerolineae bacterium]